MSDRSKSAKRKDLHKDDFAYFVGKLVAFDVAISHLKMVLNDAG